MYEKTDDTGVVSWELFNALYENQYDVFRKLRFIVKAGKVNNNESMALEMIDDYLKRKEVELKEIRQAGLEEWGRRGKTASLQEVPAREMPEHNGEIEVAPPSTAAPKGVPAREMPEHNGEIGPGKLPVPVVPVSRVSLWSRALSRNKGD